MAAESIIYRPLHPDHAEGVHELAASCIELDLGLPETPFPDPESLRAQAESDQHCSHVALEGDKVAGFILAESVRFNQEGQIFALAVDPSHRREYIGTILTLMSMSDFRRIGCERVSAYINTMDAGMIGVLDKVGIQTSRELFRYAAADLRPKQA